MTDHSNTKDDRHRVFILGAGFSCVGGLPLTRDLMPLMNQCVQLRGCGHQFHFRRAINTFFPSTEMDDEKLGEIDIEELLSLLECRHHMDMFGGEGWSEEGSKELLVMKSLLAEILSQYDECLPDVYGEFVSLLRPNDIVLTFNWDTVLEEALDARCIPYSLVPKSGLVNIIKMHGSLDWKHLGEYNAFLNETQYPQIREKICGNVYRYPCLSNVKDRRDHSLSTDFAYHSPYIILPSFVKLQWLDAIRDFWYKTESIFANVRHVTIIGYSLRKDDYHARAFLIPGLMHYLNQGPGEKLSVLDVNEKVLQNYTFFPRGRIRHYQEGMSKDTLKELGRAIE